MGGKVGLGFTRRLSRPPKPALGQAAPDTLFFPLSCAAFGTAFLTRFGEDDD
ncbi:hypothetical protein Ga0061069_11086 [Thiomonas bhubaneswarensis]|uniref:Uncharacterized protein n=1 Tax=Thiomonas bhubaneswarensis TaxID=339866 RepID=A0A0K6I9R3_9BURK|nr:hypothetical protein Ga0061069_11086 [Thiomonas bhubaneswarensis]